MARRVMKCFGILQNIERAYGPFVDRKSRRSIDRVCTCELYISEHETRGRVSMVVNVENFIDNSPAAATLYTDPGRLTAYFDGDFPVVILATPYHRYILTAYKWILDEPVLPELKDLEVSYNI